MIPDILSKAQFDTVYNFFSLTIAAQLFTSIFLLASQRRVLPRYRQALVISSIVCGIAAYHYFRIFASFKAAFVTDAKGGQGNYVQAAGESFNEGYRYVDWLLTVPLLLAELVIVLALARKLRNSLLVRLIPASALMIALGYPGEISSDNWTRNIWGWLSTIPFLYILYVLFVELTKSRCGSCCSQPGASTRSPTRCPSGSGTPVLQHGLPSRAATPSLTSWRNASTAC